MPELKGGFTATDSRLGRIPRWDPQNDDFPVRAVLRATEIRRPRSYTWAVPAVLDQGSEGACVGFAWTHELLARPRPVKGLDAAFAREQVYWPAQRIDPWEGGAYPEASPAYEGTDTLSGAKVLRAAGYFSEYRWATSIDDLIAGVGYTGPAVLGLDWYEGMFEPGEDGFIRPTGYIAGGHAILCHGVSVPGRFLKVHNSWGPGWGGRAGMKPGEARISFDDAERLLGQNGEACFPVTRQRLGT